MILIFTTLVMILTQFQILMVMIKSNLVRE